MLNSIVYGNSHECRPNGTGDYDFFCPEKEEKLFFVPYMVAILWPRLTKARCPVCGKAIGRE